MLCASFVILQLSLICEVGNKPLYLASFRIKCSIWDLNPVSFSFVLNTNRCFCVCVSIIDITY